MKYSDPVVTDLSAFLQDLGLDEKQLSYSGNFPFKVTRSYMKKMVQGSLNDPLFKQVFPAPSEKQTHPGFSRDPVNDRGSMLSPRLLKKYKGRALLLLGNSCPVHCRFCFRKHLEHSAVDTDMESLDRALDFIKNDQSINEVILSGGEPLLAPAKTLNFLKTKLEGIAHIKRLRIHTRLPSVSPARFSAVSLTSLFPANTAVFFVIHVNHPDEIDTGFSDCVNKIISAGASALSQTVLLKGVNSSVKTLSELFARLINLNVIPYYLHQLDKVEGSAHFYTDMETGVSIMDGLRKNLPGYAVPRYVQEVPESPCKVPCI